MRFTVPKELSGARLDIALRALSGISRREARRLISDGAVFVDGKRLRVQSRPMNVGSRVEIAQGGAETDQSTIEVIEKTADAVVINKPSGMPSAPTRRTARGTALEILRAQLGREQLYLVHRLDRQTSGALLFARNAAAATRFSVPFRERTARRLYLALTTGPSFSSRHIDLPLKMNTMGTASVDDAGKPAETIATVLARSGSSALLLVEPITGRSHQIRVHLAHVGAPVLGDLRYGGAASETFGLHAAALAGPDLPEVVAPLQPNFVAAARSAGFRPATLDASIAAAARESLR